MSFLRNHLNFLTLSSISIGVVSLGSSKHTIFDVSTAVSTSKWCNILTQYPAQNYMFFFLRSCIAPFHINVFCFCTLPLLWTIPSQQPELEEKRIFLFCRKISLEYPVCYKHPCAPQLSIFDISAKKTNVRTPYGYKEHMHTYGSVDTREFFKSLFSSSFNLGHC